MSNDNKLMQLVPLGYAVLSVMTDTHPEHIAPSLDINLRCCDKDVAELYKRWRELHDADHRKEWIYDHYMTNPLIIQAMQAAKEAIVTPRDAANQIYSDWLAAEKTRLLSIVCDDTRTAKEINEALSQYQSLLNASRGTAYHVDATNPPPSNDFLFAANGVRFMPKNEMTAYKAKAKSGKTQVGKILAAAAISRKSDVMRLSRWSKEGESKAPYKVLFVDTEQSKRASYKLWRSIMQMSGYPTDQNSELIDVINLRMTDTGGRYDYLHQMVSNGNYDLVIIDGIKDLCYDINDNKEADSLVVKLLSMVETYNIALSVVLHENPSKDSDKMRGHLGTEVLNKAHDVFELRKIDDVFNIVHTDSREKPVPTWAFHFEPSPDNPEYDILAPCESNDTANAKGQGQGQNCPTKEERQWAQFCKAWEQQPYLSLTKEDIVREHARLGTIKESTVKNRIKEYYHAGRLKSDGPYDEKGTRFGLNTDMAAELYARLHPAPIMSATDQRFEMPEQSTGQGQGQNGEGQLPF